MSDAQSRGCPRCGAEVQLPAKYCDMCGSVLAVTPPAASATAAGPAAEFLPELPPDVAAQLLPDERVFAFSQRKGCFGMGKRSYFLLTDSRAVISGLLGKGCLGFPRIEASTVEIPLTHISSVSAAQEGCFLARTRTIVVRSGTAAQQVPVESWEGAQQLVRTIQQVLRDQRARK